MATPTGITLGNDAVIVEIAMLSNSSVGTSKFNGGYVRQVGTLWSLPPIVDDFIQFTGVNLTLFQQGGVTFGYVPASDYLFIQAPV